MTTLYDKGYAEVALGIRNAETLGLLDHVRANELRQLVSDWFDQKEEEDNEIQESSLESLGRWGISVMGNEADQGEAMEKAGVVFSSEKLEGIVL